MTPPDPSNPKQGLQAVALVSQLGLVIAAPIVTGALFGVALEDKIGGQGAFVILGIILGVVAGVVAAYQILKPHLN